MDTSPVTGGLFVFGSPTSLLIRSDLVRGRRPFYRDKYLQVVDQEACYHLLKNTEFGFVHEVLTFSRLHTQSTTSSVTQVNRMITEELMLLLEYGPVYLDKDEFRQVLSQRMGRYYRFLAASIFERRNEEFWRFHRDGLKSLGLKVSKYKLASETFREFVRRLLILSAHPIRSFRTVLTPLKRIEQRNTQVS